MDTNIRYSTTQGYQWPVFLAGMEFAALPDVVYLLGSLEGIPPQKGGDGTESLDGKPHASRLEAPAPSPASRDFVISIRSTSTLTGHTKRIEAAQDI